MLHYTLNTADTFDCSQKKYDWEMINKTLKPIATRAISEGQTIAPLPAPFEDYHMKITADNGAALFELYLGRNLVLLLNINVVVWAEEGQESIWQELEDFYLRFCGQFGTLSISRAPVRPESLPWLATHFMPSPKAIGVPDWDDFEQCLALALIRSGRPQKKPKNSWGKIAKKIKAALVDLRERME